MLSARHHAASVVGATTSSEQYAKHCNAGRISTATTIARSGSHATTASRIQPSCAQGHDWLFVRGMMSVPSLLVHSPGDSATTAQYQGGGTAAASGGIAEPSAASKSATRGRFTVSSKECTQKSRALIGDRACQHAHTAATRHRRDTVARSIPGRGHRGCSPRSRAPACPPTQASRADS